MHRRKQGTSNGKRERESRNGFIDGEKPDVDRVGVDRDRPAAASSAGKNGSAAFVPQVPINQTVKILIDCLACSHNSEAVLHYRVSGRLTVFCNRCGQGFDIVETGCSSGQGGSFHHHLKFTTELGEMRYAFRTNSEKRLSRGEIAMAWANLVAEAIECGGEEGERVRRLGLLVDENKLAALGRER